MCGQVGRENVKKGSKELVQLDNFFNVSKLVNVRPIKMSFKYLNPKTKVILKNTNEVNMNLVNIGNSFK